MQIHVFEFGNGEIHVVEVMEETPSHNDKGREYIKSRYAAAKEVRNRMEVQDDLYQACNTLAEQTLQDLQKGVCQKHFVEQLQSRLRLAVSLGVLEGRAEVRQGAAHRN